MNDYVPPHPDDGPSSALRERLLNGVWMATFCYLLPAFGGLAVADLCYDVFEFSFIMALVGGGVFGYLAWKARPRTPPLNRSWALYPRQLTITVLFAASPIIAFTGVFWPLSYSTRYPAFLPAMAVAGLVFYVVRDWRPKDAAGTDLADRNRPPQGEPASAERVSKAIQLPTRKRDPS